MTIISWAQHAEDVVLWRAFKGVANGTYVDIGAGHPLEDSVTRLFYEHGWSGVNVEPLPSLHDLLVEHRPRDVNLAMAMSDTRGELVLWESPFDEYGISTFSVENKGRLEDRGFQFSPRTVPVGTLDEVLARFPAGHVDFLKIDVEGWEHQVLLGGRLEVHQPKVLVIEAVEPGHPIRNSELWEPIVVQAGYRPTLFDGLNLYFVHRSQRHLVEPLSIPANLFDDWVPAEQHVEHLDLELLRRRAEQFEELLSAVVAPLVSSLSTLLKGRTRAKKARLEAFVRAALTAEPTLAARTSVPLADLLDAADLDDATDADVAEFVATLRKVTADDQLAGVTVSGAVGGAEQDQVSGTETGPNHGTGARHS